MCIATTLGSILSPPGSRPICLHSVQVAWAHQKFGGLLASCSFDHKVILWKQQPDGNWVPVSFASTKCPHSQAKLEIRCCDALMLSKTPPMHMQMAALSSQCTPAALNVCLPTGSRVHCAHSVGERCGICTVRTGAAGRCSLIRWELLCALL